LAPLPGGVPQNRRNLSPLRGLEYLSPAVLENLWTTLEARTRSEAARAGGNVQDYLKNRNPLWNMVGRVVFHLAENRKNEARPFGFLVTFTTCLSGLTKPQFLPFGKAFGSSRTLPRQCPNRRNGNRVDPE
jgi:non-specific serine/threonine protein kinase